MGTGGVTTTATPSPLPYNNMNVPPMMYSNGMMNQQVQGMYGNVTPPGYVNPVAANMMMNMNMNNTSNMNMNMNSSNYVNPNYLKMMNGGVNNTNSMNMNMNMSNKPLF